MSFEDRTDAGRRLAGLLAAYKADRPVVVALPRGGVPVAAEVAAALDVPLDLVIVRKVGVPQQPELAAGAVVDGSHPIFVRNHDVMRMAGMSEHDFRRVAQAELAEIRRRRDAYLNGRPHAALAGRTVIVVDDGVATGATVRAALQAIRQARPRRLVLALPVGPADTIAALAREADDVVCVETHEAFDAIGSYYADFAQLADADVVKALADAAARTGYQGRA